MAAICWCSAGLPADKWILVVGPLGYPAHLVRSIYLAHGLVAECPRAESKTELVLITAI